MREFTSQFEQIKKYPVSLYKSFRLSAPGFLEIITHDSMFLSDLSRQLSKVTEECNNNYSNLRVQVIFDRI